MSDDTTTEPAAPRRPTSDPFCLDVTRELGLDPHVIDGTMRLEWEDDSTLTGRTGQVRISWQGSATLPEETISRIRQASRNRCASATVAKVARRGFPRTPGDPGSRIRIRAG